MAKREESFGVGELDLVLTFFFFFPFFLPSFLPFLLAFYSLFLFLLLLSLFFQCHFASPLNLLRGHVTVPSIPYLS